MAGLGGGGNTDEARAARDEASRQSILAGGLPLNAIDRLKEQASRQSTPDHIFSSDLSPNELLLTHECGFLPLGQVMGSCVYNVGWQYIPNNGWFQYSGELDTLSNSQFNARQLAFSRLRQEAKLLKADGVIGVRLYRQESDWGMGLIEFIAVGTAVRSVGAPPLASGHEPFVSNLNGQDHWMLRKDGYKPVGFAFGNCAWYQINDWRSSIALSSWSNMEVVSISQGTYNARSIAMSRLSMEAMQVGAEGVVGMTFDMKTEHMEGGQDSPGGYMMHFTAYGTAVARENSHSGVGEIQRQVRLNDLDDIHQDVIA